MVNRTSMAASKKIKLLGRKARKKGGVGGCLHHSVDLALHLLAIMVPDKYTRRGLA